MSVLPVRACTLTFTWVFIFYTIFGIFSIGFSVKTYIFTNYSLLACTLVKLMQITPQPWFRSGVSKRLDKQRYMVYNDCILFLLGDKFER